jgi:hypothetical protein
MLLEIYILLEIAVFILFLTAFYSRQEIIWGLSLVLSGIMMANSYAIEILSYSFNSGIGGYELTTTLFSYPYMMGVNLLIFGLSLLFGVFDLWDKFGQTGTGKRF